MSGSAAVDDDHILQRIEKEKNQQISVFTRFSRGKQKKDACTHKHTSFYHHLKHNLYNYFILSHSQYLFF